MTWEHEEVELVVKVKIGRPLPYLPLPIYVEARHGEHHIRVGVPIDRVALVADAGPKTVVLDGEDLARAVAQLVHSKLRNEAEQRVNQRLDELAAEQRARRQRIVESLESRRPDAGGEKAPEPPDDEQRRAELEKRRLAALAALRDFEGQLGDDERGPPVTGQPTTQLDLDIEIAT